MKHTKGPWSIELNQTDLTNIKSQNNTLIGMSLMRSNASLIATAPEILKTLEQVRDYLQESCDNFSSEMSLESELLDNVLSVIKKARGES